MPDQMPRAENRRTRREVEWECATLASGTIGSLIGDGLYTEVDKARDAFVRFVRESEAAYPNWIDAWQAFKYAGHPGYTPRERDYSAS